MNMTKISYILGTFLLLLLSFTAYSASPIITIIGNSDTIVNIYGTYRSRESKPSIAPSIAPVRSRRPRARIASHRAPIMMTISTTMRAMTAMPPPTMTTTRKHRAARRSVNVKVRARERCDGGTKGLIFDCARPDRGLRVGRSLTRVVRCRRRDVGLGEVM